MNYTVLIVDDEPWAAYGLEHLLTWEDYGFEVVGVAFNGADALALWEKAQPDVIISDIRMPELDGLALLETLTARGAKTRVVFISGYSEFEYAQRALRFGAYDYLVKQVSKESVVDVLNRLERDLRQQRETEETQPDALLPDDAMIDAVLPIKLILEYIDEHYTENLRVHELAKQFHFNADYFSALFRKSTDTTFTKYVMEKRILMAKHLLKHTDLSIQEVALKSGFQDYHQFSKLLKREIGMTPSQYRAP